MFANGVTPDGYKVNADGQWVDENGNIQVVPGKDFQVILEKIPILRPL